jgi:hypothetical protein
MIRQRLSISLNEGTAFRCGSTAGFFTSTGLNTLFRTNKKCPPSDTICPGMSALSLTRRRDHTVPQECWRVYYGDLHAGTIAQCVGNPSAAPKWQWRCGFYPGSRPGECTGGTAATFNEARKAFEAAWRVFLAKRTEADFQVWRDQRDWTAEKYRRFDRGEQMPPDWRPVV